MPVIRDCLDGRVTAPGFYRMSAAHYHADPCPAPSLSSSVAKILLRQTPLHAFHAHPRLGPPKEPSEPNAAMRLGTAVHKLLLGAGSELVVIEAADFKTKAAREARTAALASGKEAVLFGELDEAFFIAEQIKDKLAQIEGATVALSDGDAELVAIWQEGEPNSADRVWCRAMFDRCRVGDMRVWIDDLKTSGDIAGPDDLGRKVWAMDYQLSAAFYRRAIRTLLGDAFKVTFSFIFAETSPPYEVIAAYLDGAAEEIGRRQVCAAIGVWQRCMATGVWPGFPKEVVYASLPEWATASWEAREQNDPLLADVFYD